jgi:hypothetical protein
MTHTMSNNMSFKTSNRNTKKRKRSSSSSSKTLRPSKVFIRTGIEDDLEANLAFLIELVGHISIYENYADILNDRLKAQNAPYLIEVKKISDENLKKIIKKNKKNEAVEEKGVLKPTIFFGTTKVTHYKATIDGINIVNSYYNGLQKINSNNFCQTFAMMFIESSLFPGSDVSEKYNDMLNSKHSDETKEERNNRLLHNSVIAKNYACDIIETTIAELSPEDVQKTLESILVDGKSHQLAKNISLKNIIPQLIRYCRSLNEDDFAGSTFKNQVV